MGGFGTSSEGNGLGFPLLEVVAGPGLLQFAGSFVFESTADALPPVGLDELGVWVAALHTFFTDLQRPSSPFRLGKYRKVD